MKPYLITLFLFISSFTFCQQNKKDTISIENQFDEIFRKSSSYLEYKLINKDKYQLLKLNVLDSLNALKKQALEKESLLKDVKETVEKTKTVLSETQLNLDLANKKENSVSIFGMQISKISYHLFLWSIIIILLLGISYFILKFFRSNVLTKEAQDNLVYLEQEFEKHRKKTLEREQKLRRQLQDEINKQRNN